METSETLDTRTPNSFQRTLARLRANPEILVELIFLAFIVVSAIAFCLDSGGGSARFLWGGIFLLTWAVWLVFSDLERGGIAGTLFVVSLVLLSEAFVFPLTFPKKYVLIEKDGTLVRGDQVGYFRSPFASVYELQLSGTETIDVESILADGPPVTATVVFSWESPREAALERFKDPSTRTFAAENRKRLTEALAAVFVRHRLSEMHWSNPELIADLAAAIQSDYPAEQFSIVGFGIMKLATGATSQADPI